jgi:NAD+ synthase
MTLSAKVLELDAAAEVERIAARLREIVRTLRKRGLVVAISGGVDSSVCAALAVKAVGAQRVCTLILPSTTHPGTVHGELKCSRRSGVCSRSR